MRLSLQTFGLSLFIVVALIIIAMTVFFAPLGARLAHHLPVLTLKRCFSVVLVIVGLKMLSPW